MSEHSRTIFLLQARGSEDMLFDLGVRRHFLDELELALSRLRARRHRATVMQAWA